MKIQCRLIMHIWIFALRITWHNNGSGSIQFSCSVLSDSLRPHEPQHARPPCPSPIPGVHPNACPLSRWCHPTISSSVVPFSSCPQSFPASGSFWASQLFSSGGKSIRASASVLPMNIQGWLPLGLTGLISLQSKGISSLLQFFVISAHILNSLCLSNFPLELSQWPESWMTNS